MTKINRFLIALLLLAVVFSAIGCEKHDPNQDVLELALVATDEAQLAELEIYPNLQKLDLRGSSCYDAIEAYIAAHPQVEVIYDVQLGADRYDPAMTTLALEEGSYDFAQVLENLKHLPGLKNLDLPQTTLTNEQLEALAEAYPGLEVGYTLTLNGQELDPAVEELDLSHMDAAQVTESLGTLSRLTNLKRIQLMDANNVSKLSMTDVKALMDAVPGAAVQYSFELFGQTLTTADERVEYVRVEVGNEGIEQVRQALDILPNCTYFKLDRCGVDDEVMAQLREDYPDTKIVWRVFFAFYNCLTDVEMLHCTSDLTDKNVEVLKYCNDVLYLDIGHNTNLSNLTFVNYMPKLKIAIVVDCATPDIEPFGNCPDLEWLEIVNCRNVSDLSPLANCTKLKGLNMSCVFKVQDLSPLYGLKDMERLYLGINALNDGQYEEACEKMPNCWVSNTHYSAAMVSYNYAVGWRLDENEERAEWYKEVRKIFRYDENYYNHDD